MDEGTLVKYLKTYDIVHKIDAAEIHWYFVEGEFAFDNRLYIASSLCYLNGIEASIRALLMYIENDGTTEIEDLTGATLSNPLLKRAKNIGMKVELLAFPNETNFDNNLQSNKPCVNVELVGTRHNICHGNLFKYFSPELGSSSGKRFFPEEHMMGTAAIIKDIGKKWESEIQRFKRTYVTTPANPTNS